MAARNRGKIEIRLSKGWWRAVVDSQHGAAIRLEVLGPLQVRRGDERIDLGSLQQRVVLGVLALHANRPIGRAQLIEAVWGDAAPAYAVNLVQKRMSGLRRALEPVRSVRAPSQLLSWTDAGYLLSLPDGSLDRDVFDREVGRARAARAAGDLAAAAQSLHAALALWRGPALDGLSSPLLDEARDRLAERRISALEERVDIDLALGHDTDLVEELRGLVAAHPLRERLRGLLMRALYRDGRQAEALVAFREARQHVRAELGVEPTAELQALHQRILNGDPEPLAAGAPRSGPVRESFQQVPTPAQLPHGLPDFIGREAERERLTALARSGQTLMIAAITGTAGVGKTSLAVQWAHQASHHFPDGQLYANLRGFDRRGAPVDPGEVLRGFLNAFGLSAAQIPATLEDQAARYRSLLAGRRVLVVLDNARDSEQVRPLLPGTAGCLVLVTSRSRLSGLVAAGAVPVTLDLLAADEAVLLLGRRIGAGRVATEPEAAADVAVACARLPLALAIVAARAAPHPRYRLSALAAELREARGGLDAFMGETASSDARAVLSWSYHQLTDAAARLFRLLGLHPGPEITPPAAASLAGLPPRQVRRLLAELSGAHLLEERTPGRFAFHDLLRAYAAEQAQDIDPGPERRAATGRMLDHYLHSAHAADRLLYRYREPTAVDPPDPAATITEMADADEALAWLTTECPVLISVIAFAAEAGFTAHTSQLTWTITAFLNYQGKWHDWAGCVQAALRACRELGDQAGEAFGHRLLNIAYLQQGRIDEADAHAKRALDLFDKLGDKAGHARLHMELGRTLERRGDYAQALERSRRALPLFREAGDRAGEAQALCWVGWYSSRLGHHATALRYCHESLEVYRDVGGHPGEADTWDALGFAHHQLGDYDEARSCYEQALALWRDLGDRYEVATTLARLGDSSHAGGDAGTARRWWQQAKTILDDLGHPQAVQLQARLDPEGARGAQKEKGELNV